MVSVFYKSQLNAKEQRLYDCIVDGYRSMAAEIKLDCQDADVIWKVVKCIKRDMTGLFFVNFYGKTCIKYNSKDSILVCDYFFTEKQVIAYYTQLHDIADSIVNKCKGKDEAQTALRLHDYLAKSIEYMLYDDAPDSQRNLVGALINKRCCCAGYARAYKFLCEKAGIHCIYVTGRGRESGEYHAWNMLKVNNKNYYVDVTYDDFKGEKYCSREFFLLSTQELLETHIPDEEYKLPYCAESGSPLPVISNPQELLDRMRLERQYNPSFTEYRFKGPTDVEAFVNRLSKETKLKDYEIYNCIKSYIYKKNRLQRTIGIVWQ